MKIFTLGFTKKTAETFFSTLKNAGVRKLLDVRLNNVSQLAGFTKRDDLRYFSREICGMDYTHLPQLAPTQQMLDEYRKSGIGWPTYAQNFLGLMAARQIEAMDREILDGACLLCSEDKPHHCHRRLVAEYLREKWTDVVVVHL